MTGANQSNGAEAMVRMLARHGVRHIFGLCGDTSLPFYDALARLDHDMTHILTRCPGWSKPMKARFQCWRSPPMWPQHRPVDFR